MALPPQTKGRVVPSNRGGLGEGAREGRAGVGEPRKLIHQAEPKSCDQTLPSAGSVDRRMPSGPGITPPLSLLISALYIQLLQLSPPPSSP